MMRTRIDWRRLVVVGWMASLLSMAPEAQAGRIFVSGHDPDFHAQNSAGARGLLSTSLGWVRQGNPLPFLVIQTVRGPIPGGHRDPYVTLKYSMGYVEGVDFHMVDAAGFMAADLSQYSAIFVESDFGGMLRWADLQALIARKNDVINYLNAGGGLVAWAESGLVASDIGVNSPYFFGFLPFLTTGYTYSQHENGFTVTPYGASIGIANQMVNGEYSHSIFLDTGGMNVVDYDSNGNIMSLAWDGWVGEQGVCERTEPHTQGYWHRQCAGLDAGGPPVHPDFDAADLQAVLDGVEADLQAVCDASESTCDALQPDPHNDPCERACKQYAALLLNLESGYLGGACCTEAGSAGDVASDVADLIAAGECKAAADLADAVNTGNILSEECPDESLLGLTTGSMREPALPTDSRGAGCSVSSPDHGSNTDVLWLLCLGLGLFLWRRRACKN